jgi:universal stress protein A
MFQNILVPTDLSPDSRRALEIGVALASGPQPRVHAFHVIETIEDASFEEIKDFYARLEERARQGLDALLPATPRKDVEIQAHIAYGSRAQAILQFAREKEIDLIVLMSHKIELKAPVQGWGTISYKVGILAQCPVMLVK